MIDAQTISILFAGLSIAASLVYYASVLQNANKTQQMQLETRQAQVLMTLMNTFRSTDFRLQWHKLWRLDLEDYEDWLDRYGEDTETLAAWTSVTYFFESVGVIVKNGLIDLGLIYPLLGTSVILAWERHHIVLMGEREAFKERGTAWDDFEYLYDEVVKYKRENP